MNDINNQSDIHRISHLLTLVINTAFSLVLITETVLLDWEKWVIPLIVVGLCTSWWLHISRAIVDVARLWFYATIMMAQFFFFGIHTTAMYDMSAIITGIMMIYGMTGVTHLITFAQITFFITYIYDIVELNMQGARWDTVETTRACVHPAVVIIVGYIIRLIIREWQSATQNADEKIEDLKNATRRMDDFLVNVSHEIRTPVNAVIGLTNVILEKKDEGEEKKNLVAVNAAGHRIAEQIGDILDYTEIDMDKLVVTNETYMMASILNDLITDLTNAMQIDPELIIDVDASLPRALSGDAVKIKKILRHLIVNGIKFTKSGGVYVHIFSQKRTYGVNLCIEIKDTGAGMSHEEIEHVFDNFYQSDSGRSRSVSGLGLGTSIVYGFVREMGGFLTIDSKKDQGTTVSVSIPQKIVDDSSCMTVSNANSLCIASLLRYRAFKDPQIREFYTDLVLHLASGLNLPFYQAESMDNLRDLLKKYQLTHLFIGAEEYMAEPLFYENVAKNTLVVVIADEGFTPRPGSKVTIVKKPFYCFPVINVLETDAHESVSDEESMRMTCPGLKVLVVDDEPMNLIVAKGILSRYDMSVTTASSGPKAIDLCKDNHYDIVFMDHMMPEMDGIEAMRRIRTIKNTTGDNKDIMFVALTANVISSARNMFLSEGFDGFVAKPIEKIELERVLKKLLPKSAIDYKSIEKDMPASSGSPEKDEKAEKTNGDILKDVGIDEEIGISYCQDDPNFYRTILREYGSKESEKKSELEYFYDAADWENYTIRIHALKSTSKMIGAQALFEKAMALEKASKEKDEATIRAFHAECMKLYEDTAAAILIFLAKEV